MGWGEGTFEGQTEAVEGSYRDLSERFIGCNADNIQDIWQNGRSCRGGPVLMVSLTCDCRMIY
jgi:galactonate dehydratase